jgi:hypothetical protein
MAGKNAPNVAKNVTNNVAFKVAAESQANMVGHGAQEMATNTESDIVQDSERDLKSMIGLLMKSYRANDRTRNTIPPMASVPFPLPSPPPSRGQPR